MMTNLVKINSCITTGKFRKQPINIVFDKGICVLHLIDINNTEQILILNKR